jgi:hypothetical protein
MPLIYPPFPAPSGVNKKPQIQTFGLGSAQYVTVTGENLGTSRVIAKIKDIQWMIEEYNVSDTDHDPGHETSKPRGDSPDKVRRLLSQIDDFDDRDVWVKVGMGLHHEFDGDHEGLELWNEWAEQSGKFDEDDSRRVWESFSRGGTTIRSLDFLARRGKSVFDDSFSTNEWEPPKPPARLGRVMQAADFAAACGPTKCLVYNLLPASGLCQIFGEPACGKTPFALSLSLHVALGKNWFGHELERPGASVYMVGEDMTGVRDRVAGQLSTLDPHSRLSDLSWYGTSEPGRLIDEEDAKRWVEDIRKIVPPEKGPISLLVIDTQNRNFGPGNENSTEDMTRFVDNIDFIRRELECCVLLVHHVGLEDKSRGRGSSVLFGALDVVFEVNKSGMSVRMTPHKHKNWARPADLNGTLVPVVVGIDEKGRDQTAITLSEKITSNTPFIDVNDPQLKRVLESIRFAEGEPITQKEMCSATGLTRKQLRSMIGKLSDAGMINIRGGTGGAPTSYSITEFGVASFFPEDDSEQAEIDEILS